MLCFIQFSSNDDVKCGECKREKRNWIFICSTEWISFRCRKLLPRLAHFSFIYYFCWIHCGFAGDSGLITNSPERNFFRFYFEKFLIKMSKYFFKWNTQKKKIRRNKKPPRISSNLAKPHLQQRVKANYSENVENSYNPTYKLVPIN